ncbi:MAG: DNA polymerase Y family protein [Gammaproteobacteria bacterium]|nr:DNA polymerase Y family protein [Gammaproteobacteria bacterium]
MNVRARDSRTADLFAAELAAASPPAPASAPTPIPIPAAAPPPPAPPAARAAPPRRPSLWYAVLFPELLDAPAAPQRLVHLARRAQRYTSLVSLEPPAALLLEIRGSLRLFGAPDALRARIDADWAHAGLRARSAAAPSPLAALWLARAGASITVEDPAALAGRLASLPLACTGWEAPRLERLRAIGIVRLGELLRLPRAGLARRFGPALLAELDAALARVGSPRRAFVPPERFAARRDFEVEIEETARLAAALAPLVERCARFLCARRAGVQRLQLRLWHRTAPATRVTLGFAGVTGDPRRLQRVLEERLSQLVLVAPVRAAALASGALESLPGESGDAFGGAATSAAALPLIERLRARLGEHAVYGVAAIAEHRPEVASRRVREPGLADARPPLEAMGVPRPVLLLPTPRRLAASPAADARPCDWRLERGPERIESGWWDGADVARDYYVACDRRGARGWIFQERRDRHWYLHGLFA